MRRTLIALGATGITFAIACGGASNTVPGIADASHFASCTDPHIKPAATAAVDASPEIQDRLAHGSNRATSASEAADIFVSSQSNASSRAYIDGFIKATDFSRDKLVFRSTTFMGDPPLVIGAALEPGKFLLVENQCYAGGGGMARSPQTEVEIFRVPVDDELVLADCGECPPPPPCCPP